MNTQKLSKLLLDHIQYGGVTISEEGKVLTTGIAVALNSTSEYIIWPWTASWEASILNWLETIQQTEYLHDTNIGMWVDENGSVVLDQIRVFPSYDLSKAITHASMYNQKAVHFLDQNITLWLTEPNKS